MEFKDPRRAFEEAISQGRLSTDESAVNWAGHYMYMGTSEGVDLFKHIDTRIYLSPFSYYDFRGLLAEYETSQTLPPGSAREGRS